MTSEGCHHANSVGTVKPGSESTSLMGSVAVLASIKLSQGVFVCVCAGPERAATKLSCCSNTHVAFFKAEGKFKNTLLLCIMTTNSLTRRLKEKRLFNKIFFTVALERLQSSGGLKDYIKFGKEKHAMDRFYC